MPSADFSPLIAPSHDGAGHIDWRRDLPGYCATTFLPHTRRIYIHTFRVTLGFASFGLLAQMCMPLCASCSSGREFAFRFLQTIPHGIALAVPLVVPVTKAHRGLSPPSYRALPGAPIKAGRGRKRLRPAFNFQPPISKLRLYFSASSTCWTWVPRQ